MKTFDEIMKAIDSPKQPTRFDSMMAAIDNSRQTRFKSEDELFEEDHPYLSDLKAGFGRMAAGGVRTYASILETAGADAEQANLAADYLFKGTEELTTQKEGDELGEYGLLKEMRFYDAFNLAYRHSLQSAPISWLAMTSAYGGVLGKAVGALAMGIPAYGSKI